MSEEQTPNKPEYWAPSAGQHGMTGFHYAAYCNDPDDVSQEIATGIPIDTRDDAGRTALFWSIDMAEAWGNPERVVFILLSAGALANSADNSGFTVFMVACGRNNLDIIRQLIDAGADIHARNADSSPLHEAAGCNFHECITMLLNLGLDPTSLNGRGLTPLQIAEVCEFDAAIAVLKTSCS